MQNPGKIWNISPDPIFVCKHFAELKIWGHKIYKKFYTYFCTKTLLLISITQNKFSFSQLKATLILLTKLVYTVLIAFDIYEFFIKDSISYLKVE